MPNPSAMLAAIGRAQTAYIVEADAGKAFNGLLSDLLSLTLSEYGFIGEVLHTAEGKPYLKTHAITNIAWDEATQRFYEENAPKGMAFYNLKTLFGHVLTSRQPVIANDPGHDPRRGGLPAGHPPLDAFLGIPIVIGSQFVGMIGLANRHGGYSQGLLEALDPLISTAGNMILARRAKHARRESADLLKRLSLVASKTTNAVIITDAQGRTEWVNAGFERISGYRLPEILGRSPGSLLQGPDTDAEQVAMLRAAIAARQPCEVDVLNYAKDGRPYWVHISLDPVFDEAGALLNFIAIETDITEARQNRVMVEEAQAYLQALVDASSRVAIIATDTSGLITVFNTGAEQMLGYTSAEMVSKQTPAIIHLPPEVAARGEELSRLHGRPIQGFDVVVDAARQGRTEQREWTYVRKDGTHLTVDLAISAIRDGQGGIKGFLGVASDITARKRAEQDNARLAEMVRNSSDFIGLAAMDEHALFLNPAGRALVGITPEADISRLRMQEFLSETTLDRLEHEILPTLQQTGSWLGEAQFRHFVTGQPIDVEFNIFVIHDPATGRPTGFATASRDITERKRMDRMKSEFVSTVSHELRTPLTAIRGALGLLAGGALGALPDPARELVDTAHRNSERLTVLINDLLDMEKIAAGQMRFDLQPQPVMPLVEQAIQAIQAYAEQFQVRLLLAERLDAAQVNVDAQRFQQVLSNFLSNAVKFSPAGGQVTVRVSRADARVRVTVADQGTGVPDDFRDRIFQKFSQADASDTRAKGGTGLGLAITKELAERMGGNVGFESAQEMGATFFVVMPAVDGDCP
jgi:PAS domain S-box-containing protein